ncbi:LysE family translocator [Salipiger sp. P9]|uniref:LysE family translocator n=1 Tax=Salipiger pentaromativorans TaxID=2943193 RepID=UPI0021578A7A|nr:LysE family translocator [Salipiger pentaromativorans]MCR8547952.1 LysE family translocator [Salipiger pentaromativorans]
MDLAAALTLVLSTAVLVAIPGPNVALIVGNTLRHGLRHGAATVAGTTLGVALQVGLVVAGLAALLDLAGWALHWLRWAGVVYLLWLGVAAWRRGAEGLAPAEPPRCPPLRLVGQGALVAAVNPKTLLFNAAFLPQFVAPEGGAAALAGVAGLYLTVLFAGDLLWALAARRARRWLQGAGRLRHRLTGALYLLAGTGLALARLPR